MSRKKNQEKEKEQQELQQGGRKKKKKVQASEKCTALATAETVQERRGAQRQRAEQGPCVKKEERGRERAGEAGREGWD